MEKLLTVQDLAEKLQMSRGQIYSLSRSKYGARNQHQLPKVVINGNLRFREKDIEQWIETLSQESGE
jgi:predicted DNA-binding transcriptional regulator AlpA